MTVLGIEGYREHLAGGDDRSPSSSGTGAGKDRFRHIGLQRPRVARVGTLLPPVARALPSGAAATPYTVPPPVYVDQTNAPAGSNLAEKPSPFAARPPSGASRNGKSVDPVKPPMIALPDRSTAAPVAASAPLPPRKVEETKSEPSGVSFATKAWATGTETA